MNYLYLNRLRNVTNRLRSGVKTPYQRAVKKIPPMMKGTGKKQNSDALKNFKSERPPLIKNRNSVREYPQKYSSIQNNCVPKE